MQISDTTFSWLHRANEERFTRELEIRRIAAERIDEQRAAGRTSGGARRFLFRRN